MTHVLRDNIKKVGKVNPAGQHSLAQYTSTHTHINISIARVMLNLIERAAFLICLIILGQRLIISSRAEDTKKREDEWYFRNSIEPV
jgi:hypothetical protein